MTIASAATLTLALAALVYFSRWVLLAALIGIGIGTLASPLLAVLHRKLKIPQGLGAVVFMLLLLGTIGIIGYVLVGLISSELLPLIADFPKLLGEARSKLMHALGKYDWFRNNLESLDLGPAAQRAIQTIYQGLQLGTVALAGFSFSLFVALYFASNPGAYERGFLSLFPAYRRAEIRDLLRLAAKNLRQWFYAQLIAMSVVGATTGLGLWFIDVPYSAGFGLLTALLDIIPYIGPMIAFSAVSVITLASDPGNMLWVALIFVLMQNFEGDVVIPLVMRAGVQLPPIHLMVLMLVMGQWFGILGILIAPPVLAIGRSIYLRTHAKRMDALAPPALPAPQPRKEQRKAG